MASLVGTNYYNGGWTATSFTAPSGYGYPGFGSGKYVVMKVTSATASESISGQFMIQVPISGAATVASYPVRCAITTTAPSFSSTPSPPSSYVSYNVSITKDTYGLCYFWTPKLTIKSGTTYYIWLWSTSSTVAYHGHSSSTGYMAAVGVALPTVGLEGYKGYYSGCNLTANYTSYPYIYATSTSSGTFYKKADSGTAVAVNADTSSTTTKTIYVIRTDYDFGSTIPYYGNQAPSRNVYRFACAVYNGTSSYTVKEGNSGSITVSYNTYTFKGLTTSATATSGSSVSFSSSSNGKVYYAIHQLTENVEYYRGNSTKNIATATDTIYGKGSHSLSLPEPTRTCLADSNYTFQGWSTGKDTTKEYDTLLDAWKATYIILYGVYKKASSSSTTTVYYYRGNSTKNSVKKTTTVADAYYYGTGSTSGGSTTYSYGTITSTCAADSSATLVGWTTSSSSTTSSYSTAKAAFDAGKTTIYGIFKKAASSSDSTVYYYRGSSTKNSVTKTTKVADKYYYGIGSTSGGSTTYSYGTITSTCAADSSATLVGWTTSDTSKTSSYSTAKAAFDAGNTTIYGIFQLPSSSSTSTVYYYAGTATKHSVTKTTSVASMLYYGKGSTDTGNASNTYGSISTSIDGWTLTGFTTSPTAIAGSSSTAEALFDAGNTTIYATYRKSETMTYDPQNGKPVGTVSITNYLYGTGQSTNYYPAEPTRLAKANHSMKGWSSSQSDTTVNTWNALWDAGVRIVYAIFEPVNYIRFGEDSSWIEAKVYYGVDGVWKPSLIRYMYPSTENTSTLSYSTLGNINLGE